MKVRTYDVLMRAVDEGISFGVSRAFKYADHPTPDSLQESLQLEIRNAICEVFVFADPSEI